MEHSKKPNEVRTRIVELVGDIPRVELFARKVDGWEGILEIECKNKKK